jgi:hypothetical protein
MYVSQMGPFGRPARNRFDLHQRAVSSIGLQAVYILPLRRHPARGLNRYGGSCFALGPAVFREKPAILSYM